MKLNLINGEHKIFSWKNYDEVILSLISNQIMYVHLLHKFWNETIL